MYKVIIQRITLKDIKVVFKSHGIGDSLINPIYVWIERSFPADYKNVSFVDMGLV